MFLVERDSASFTVSCTLDEMGMRASDTAELVFQNVRVPAENLLGREGVGFYEVMRVFQRERLVAGLHAVSTSATSSPITRCAASSSSGRRTEPPGRSRSRTSRRRRRGTSGAGGSMKRPYIS
jgi:hypothetical protein